MTARTIMTVSELDALPVGSVVMWHDEDGWARAAVRWPGSSGWLVTGSEETAEEGSWVLAWAQGDGSPLTLLHDPSAPAPVHVCTTHCEQGRGHYPAPVVPVVSDAAVEAAARAMYFEDCGMAPSAEVMAGEDYDSRFREYARAVLSAALPHLGAAPSATREEVSNVALAASSVTITDSPHQKAQWLGIADALLARFTITPRTDR